ncbi:hypothetical protein HID58_018413 [Brassica napus]|uniref:Amino acid transporter transmembrane domain-containing protein n=1 Tax=Brassica napus TaxID=3708 RepID=A0ABQ8D9U2_BRANA|nr:hypothetical protein HID58_018413 [Brassica napus]
MASNRRTNTNFGGTTNSNRPTEASTPPTETTLRVECLERQKEIDDWLPITSSRNAKWWYSAFHNVTAMVGAGVGVCIVYMVTGGQSLKKFHELVCQDWSTIRLPVFIMIFASSHFVLSHLPNFNSISLISLVAAVMSLSYSTISWTTTATKGVQEDVQYGYKAGTTADTVLNFFTGLGGIAFSYAGHSVVLEIQATLPSTTSNPSKDPMWKGVMVAYVVVALCYFPLALVGYGIFGNDVSDNILISLKTPVSAITLANLFVVMHVIGSYQIFAMPVFDMVETFLVKKLNFKPSSILRFILRNVTALTMFIAIMIPFFGGLLAFFGGFAFAPTTYFLPCIIWLVIYKPKRFGLSWRTNWVCIVPGFILMILSSIGGLRQIILESKDYSFFS